MNLSFITPFIVTLWLSIFLSVACSDDKTQKSDSSNLHIPSVIVTHVVEEMIEERIPFFGNLIPKEEVLILSQGDQLLIKELKVNVGDSVKKGDVLVVLDSTNLEAQKAQALAQVARTQALVDQNKSAIKSTQAQKLESEEALARNAKLRKEGDISQAAFDKATTAASVATANYNSAIDGSALANANLAQAKAQLLIAQTKLSYATITAPVDGVISQKNGKIGAIVSPSTPSIYKIIRDGIVEVEAQIVEGSFNKVKASDKVQVNIAQLGDQIGAIRLISPAINPETRLGSIRISLKDQSNIHAGMFATGWIISEAKQALTVPNSAVQIDGDQRFVFVVKNDVTAKTIVKTGLLWQGQREIISGLSKGDMIVAYAGAFLSNGDKIRPVVEDNTARAGANK